MSDIDPNYPYIALIVVDDQARAVEFMDQNFSVIGLTDCRIETQRVDGGGYLDSVNLQAETNSLGSLTGISKGINRRKILLNVIIEMSDEEQFAFLDTILSIKLNKDTTRHPTKGSTALGFLNCVITNTDDLFLVGEVLPGQIHIGDIIKIDHATKDEKLVQRMAKQIDATRKDKTA